MYKHKIFTISFTILGLWLVFNLVATARDSSTLEFKEGEYAIVNNQIAHLEIVKCELERDMARIKMDERNETNLSEQERQRLSAIEVRDCQNLTPVVNKNDKKVSVVTPPQKTSESVQNEALNLDRLAYAISMAETKNCQLGYGAEYNNCFGIKNGSIAPCVQQGRNRMCIYSSPEESYEAFKAIWSKGYGGTFPSYKMAATWTGNDRPDNWLRIVNHYYHEA